MTVTLSNRGLDSLDLKGLVLLLCPGVELALLAERCELRRCGSGRRTMADDDSKAERGEKQRTCKKWGNEREKKKKRR
jgi:hypothetical protein